MNSFTGETDADIVFQKSVVASMLGYFRDSSRNDRSLEGSGYSRISLRETMIRDTPSPKSTQL